MERLSILTRSRILILNPMECQTPILPLVNKTGRRWSTNKTSQYLTAVLIYQYNLDFLVSNCCSDLSIQHGFSFCMLLLTAECKCQYFGLKIRINTVSDLCIKNIKI